MRMLDATGINSNSFTGNSTTFFNEGKRQVGLELLSRISELGIDAVKLKQKAELEDETSSILQTLAQHTDGETTALNQEQPTRKQ